jgi:hypothetical protein
VGERVDLEELERRARSLVGCPECARSIDDEAVLALIARLRDLEAGMAAVLRSASPHPVEHPTMAAAWEAGHALLVKGVVLP